MHCTARNNTIISYLGEEEQQRRRQSSWERLHLVETSCLRNWLSAEHVVVDWAFLPTCELACFLPEQDESVLYVCCAGSPICVFNAGEDDGEIWWMRMVASHCQRLGTAHLLIILLFSCGVWSSTV